MITLAKLLVAAIVVLVLAALALPILSVLSLLCKLRSPAFKRDVDRAVDRAGIWLRDRVRDFVEG